MRKKVTALFMTAVMVIGMTTAAFAAETVTSTGSSAQAEVKGTYVAGTASESIYSVDISWGSLEFTYTSASEGTWNPESHAYDGATEGAWSCEEGANVFTVTNHSNAYISASFSYSSIDGLDAVTGSFDQTYFNLKSAVGTEVSAAPSDTATLTLSGELDSTYTTSAKIGTVTITIDGPMA